MSRLRRLKNYLTEEIGDNNELNTYLGNLLISKLNVFSGILQYFKFIPQLCTVSYNF